MKKVILSLVLGLGVLSATSSIAATPAFSASNMAQFTVKDLSFKEVMRQLYNGRMRAAYFNDEELGSMPYVGLDSADSEGFEAVAVMHPVIPYVNSVGEPRYLVIIEKVEVIGDALMSCHACGATADLYSFKPLNSGLYQLVSRTPDNVEFSSSWGRVGLNGEDILNGLQALGQNLVGSIFENGYGNRGTYDSWLEVLHLPEDGYINLYSLGDAGSDNSGNHEESSPLHYSYEVKATVLPDGSRYYPIALNTVGDKPSEDYDRIDSVNYTNVVKFNPAKKEYQ